jgi:APA family basic amino acid/polyamine antiporter
MATGLFYYLANFVPILERPAFVLPLPIGPGGGPLEIRYGQFSAVAIILALALLNYWGTRLGGGVQVATTAAKIGLLAAIIALGLLSGKGSLANLTSQVPVQAGVAGFFAALVAALWAYDGWNNLGMAASEVERPQRNLPLALITGTLIVIAVYLAANLAYFYVLPATAVAASDRVAAEMMRRIAGPAGAHLVSIAAIISIFAALNGAILTGARIPYAMAHDGRFFHALGRVSPARGTPGPAILVVCLWSSLLVFTGRFEQLFTYVIFANWLIFAMGAAAVLVLRRTQPGLPRPYRTPAYPLLPVLFVAAALSLVIATLLNSPRESLMGLGIILTGLPFYSHWKRRAL